MRRAACALALLLVMFTVAPALAATVFYVYDELGRLVAEIDAVRGTTRYTYDAAGNLLSVTNDASTQFRLDGFSPSAGKVGDAVTIFGAGFLADPSQNTVRFNGTAATVTLATAHSLVATVPSGATSGPISVANANGSATTTQPFTVIAPPAIGAVVPAYVLRGQTSRVDITGASLDSAAAVNFAQSGFSARIVVREPTRLTIDLTVAGTVPFGAYAFSVTNYAGTTQSGAVTVNVTTALVGDAMSVARPLSVHLAAVIAGTPAGNAISATQPLSVYVPAVISGTPSGNAMNATQPLSVYVPAVIAGTPSGNAMNATLPLSVYVPAVIAGTPDGNAMSVTEPLSVSMP